MMFPKIKDKELREYIDYHEKCASKNKNKEWDNPIDIKMLSALNKALGKIHIIKRILEAKE